MATVRFDPGDTFRTADGFGVVLNEGQALVIKGKGGRKGYTSEKAPIPTDATPCAATDTTPYEVRFALEMVKKAIV